MAKADKKASESQKQTENERSFIIKQIFIKKSALVVDKAPFELKEEWNPDAEMKLDVKTQEVDKDHQLVELEITIDVKISKQQVFTIDVTQSGIFEMIGYTAEQNDQLRNTFCPNILFPYARQIISQLTSQAGFPPLIVAPVDFEGRYQQLKAVKSS